MLKEITVLGDSIARGLMYDHDAARYRVCKNTFMGALTAKGYKVRNLARVGCTVDKATELFEGCEKKDGALLAVELGGNDSDLIWKEVSENPDVYHEAVVLLRAYRERLTALLRRARAGGLSPIVVTPLPVVADRYMDWVSRGLDAAAIRRYLGCSEYIYHWQERYAFEAMKAAAREDCPVFDLRSVFLGRRDFSELFCEDGIHPNADGHAVIARAVEEAEGRYLEGGLLI